jgi:hypothetical protein
MTRMMMTSRRLNLFQRTSGSISSVMIRVGTYSACERQREGCHYESAPTRKVIAMIYGE